MADLQYDVLVYGTICLDIAWRVPELPAVGGYADVLEERKLVGGEAVNTAIALARWGVRVALAGNALGDDDEGELLADLFARQAPEIDLSYVERRAGVETPCCLCMATDDGARTMIGRGFTKAHNTPLDAALAGSARLFTVEPNAYAAGIAAARVAASAGCALVPMDYTREPEMNRMASVVLTSTDHVGVRPQSELEAYARAIRDDFGPAAIVTRGELGSVVADEQGVAAIPAYRAPAVVDTTGCGDVFRAGILYGLLQDWNLRRCISFASAAAALNCTELGAWTGVRSVEEILQYASQAR